MAIHMLPKLLELAGQLPTFFRVYQCLEGGPRVHKNHPLPFVQRDETLRW